MSGDLDLLKSTVKKGFKYLTALRLPFTPALDKPEAWTALVRVWTDTLFGVRRWDETSCHALEQAFRLAGSQLKQWPCPADVLEHLRIKPAAKVFKALPEPPKTDADRKEIDRICGEMFQSLQMPTQPMPKQPKTSTVQTASTKLIYTSKE